MFQEDCQDVLWNHHEADILREFIQISRPSISGSFKILVLDFTQGNEELKIGIQN